MYCPLPLDLYKSSIASLKRRPYFNFIWRLWHEIGTGIIEGWTVRLERVRYETSSVESERSFAFLMFSSAPESCYAIVSGNCTNVPHDPLWSILQIGRGINRERERDGVRSFEDYPGFKRLFLSYDSSLLLSFRFSPFPFHFSRFFVSPSFSSFVKRDERARSIWAWWPVGTGSHRISPFFLFSSLVLFPFPI